MREERSELWTLDASCRFQGSEHARQGAAMRHTHMHGYPRHALVVEERCEGPCSPVAAAEGARANKAGHVRLAVFAEGDKSIKHLRRSSDSGTSGASCARHLAEGSPRPTAPPPAHPASPLWQKVKRCPPSVSHARSVMRRGRPPGGWGVH